MATKKYGGIRIMSLEGSVLYKNEGFTATKDGKPDPQAFRGILDESLDTWCTLVTRAKSDILISLAKSVSAVPL